MNDSPDRDELALRAPYEYIREMPGKQVRSQLALAFNHWMQVDQETLKKIMSIIEMLHNASLLVDDIEDNSVLRRGLPVTHSIFGAPRTINSANYMYFVALDACLQLHPEAVHVFSQHLLELHRGQGKELYWRETVQCPSEEEYEQMVLQKTGGLFFLAIRLMALFCPSSPDFSSLLTSLALFFQIRDDLLNLFSDEMAKLKTFAEDLTEGKFSYPIILALKGRSPDDQVLNILRQRTQNVEVKAHCVQILRERNAYQMTISRLAVLSKSIEADIERLGGNEKLSKVLGLLQKELQEIH